MIVLFTDSNLFLHCRSLADLPWHEISSDAEIRLLVPRAVQQELDRLKNDGKSRRADRARRATSLFREAIDSEQTAPQTVLRSDAPRVTLSFPPLPDPNRERPAQLDLTRSDDRLIEEILAYRAINEGADVRLLTNDTNAMLTARQCSLSYIAIPENWLLPPEPDERDKALAEVQRRLSALERQFPEIQLHVEDAAGNEIGQVSAEIDIYPDIPENIIDELVEALQSQQPMATVFEGHGLPVPPTQRSAFDFAGGHYKPPSERALESYREEYSEWVEELPDFFKKLPRMLERRKRRLSLTLVLENTGVCPAENVIVETKAVGGLLIAPPLDSNDEMANSSDKPPKLPLPPSAPRSRYIQGLREIGASFALNPTGGMLDSLASIHRAEERDPHAFYWKGGRPTLATEEEILTCEELRHQVDPMRLEVAAWLPTDASKPKGALIFRVTASNLPEPVTLTVPVTISRAQRDTVDAARRLLGDEANKIGDDGS